MKPRSSRLLGVLCGVLLLACLQPHLFAKAPRANPTLHSLIGLRDAFVERVRENGPSCALPPAHLKLSDRALYGRYDPKSNVLRIPVWRRLKAKERRFFEQLTGPGADEAQAREVFETAQRWNLIRELGHWWQTCRQTHQGRSPYQIEFDADRIAAAYWREADPALLDKLATGFREALKGQPVQLPAGETPERYFNEHFDAVIGSPSYTWFEAFMIASIEAEEPLPSFRDTLAEAGSPARLPAPR